MTATPKGTVFFLVPDGIDDDEAISGGNVYDRRLRENLRALGWDVQMVLVSADRADGPSTVLLDLSDDSLVLVDGILALALSPVVEAQAGRLRILVLAHMVATGRRSPDGARRVIATSRWTRSELIARDLAAPDRIVVAYPGTDEVAPLVARSAPGSRLLCVGAVAPHKGYDVLLEALAATGNSVDWSCTIVGSLTVAPDYVAELRAGIRKAGLQGRMNFTGVLTGTRLDEAYNSSDLLVAPSRIESYGMAVTEALARGIPVVATRVGGIPEAVAGNPAGVFVPPDDPWVLGVVLHRWAGDAAWRTALSEKARRSRGMTRSWHHTAAVVSAALIEVAQMSEVRA